MCKVMEDMRNEMNTQTFLNQSRTIFEPIFNEL